MRRDSRLSVALHVLLHMSDADRPLTSEVSGPMMDLNPVVLRRTLAGLREAGIVRSEKGHGGGWSLARPLESVSLGDVYVALGVSAPFAIGHRELQPTCPLERSVNRSLGAALNEAESLLVKRLHGIAVASWLADVRRVAERAQ